jgi:hypothetical protein
MATLSVTLSRTALTLPDLDISIGLYRVEEDGIDEPDRIWQKEYARSTRFHGAELTGASLEQSSLPISGFVLGSTAVELKNAVTALEEALGQWTFETTVTLDGLADVWQCDPADLRTGPIRHGEQAALLRKFAVTIPVYPIPGSP